MTDYMKKVSRLLAEAIESFGPESRQWAENYAKRDPIAFLRYADARQPLPEEPDKILVDRRILLNCWSLAVGTFVNDWEKKDICAALCPVLFGREWVRR